MMILEHWKPTNKQTYWFYLINIDCAVNPVWSGCTDDYCRWKVGNCFKSKEEAETLGKQIMLQLMEEHEQ